MDVELYTYSSLQHFLSPCTKKHLCDIDLALHKSRNGIRSVKILHLFSFGKLLEDLQNVSIFYGAHHSHSPKWFLVESLHSKLRLETVPGSSSRCGALTSINFILKSSHSFVKKNTVPIWLFPKMVVPNNHGFSYEKWSFCIILGCFGGTTILGNPHMYLFLCFPGRCNISSCGVGILADAPLHRLSTPLISDCRVGPAWQVRSGSWKPNKNATCTYKYTASITNPCYHRVYSIEYEWYITCRLFQGIISLQRKHWSGFYSTRPPND